MSEADFKTKYLKYKKKYLDLKSQIEGGAGGSVFSSKKVFYAGLLQKNSPFQEIRGTFRDGFFKDTNEIAMAKLKLLTLENAFRFMQKQNTMGIKIYEDDWAERLGLAPFNTIYPILLDPLPRLAFDEVNLDFYDKEGNSKLNNSPIFVRNIENEQELYDAFNQKDKFGSLYTGAERKVEHLKVLMTVTNRDGSGWPRLFSGPYAMKGTKHPVIRIEDNEEIRVWLQHGLTLSEKLKNDDLIAEYQKKTGKHPGDEIYEKNKKEIGEFYLKALRKFTTLNEILFEKNHGKRDPIAAIERIPLIK